MQLYKRWLDQLKTALDLVSIRYLHQIQCTECCFLDLICEECLSIALTSSLVQKILLQFIKLKFYGVLTGWMRKDLFTQWDSNQTWFLNKSPIKRGGGISLHRLLQLFGILYPRQPYLRLNRPLAGGSSRGGNRSFLLFFHQYSNTNDHSRSTFSLELPNLLSILGTFPPSISCLCCFYFLAF